MCLVFSLFGGSKSKTHGDNLKNRDSIFECFHFFWLMLQLSFHASSIFLLFCMYHSVIIFIYSLCPFFMTILLLFILFIFLLFCCCSRLFTLRAQWIERLRWVCCVSKEFFLLFFYFQKKIRKWSRIHFIVWNFKTRNKIW